jgi:hypothetical protein
LPAKRESTRAGAEYPYVVVPRNFASRMGTIFH